MRNLILTLIIWMICFTAITIGVSLTYKWYRHLGKDIYIHFHDVSGLVPNQSKIMYRGVDIGTINEIELDLTTGNPRIRARIVKQAMPLLGPQSKFWVVSPEVSVGAVHNLSTISTGDYVAVFPIPGKFTEEFYGLAEAPVDHKFSAGLRVVLKANDATGIEVGSEILYHDLSIGEVGEMGLSDDGKKVMITVYIDKPYVKVIRTNSYFANVSGFYADINIFTGSKITLDSIRTLIRGGIKVVTPDFKCPLAKDGDIFKMLSREQYNALEES
ncbi:MAG TPA: MlaD family protein [Gammaproteobacteria bacterium]|nr:MlaD family protein [Gammaproteobacteria bacterium]